MLGRLPQGDASSARSKQLTFETCGVSPKAAPSLFPIPADWARGRRPADTPARNDFPDAPGLDKNGLALNGLLEAKGFELGAAEVKGFVPELAAARFVGASAGLGDCDDGAPNRGEDGAC